MENNKDKITKFFNIENIYVDIISAGYKSLEQKENPLCFNNFCLAYRILIERFFKEDFSQKKEKIKQSPWFQKEWQNNEGEPSSKAYIRYKLFDVLSDANLDKFEKVNENIKNLSERVEYINNCVHFRKEKKDCENNKTYLYNFSEIEIQKGVAAIEESIIKIIDIYESVKYAKIKMLTSQFAEKLTKYLEESKEFNIQIDDFYIKDTEVIENKEKETKLKIIGEIDSDNQSHIFKTELSLKNLVDNKETFFEIISIDSFDIKYSYKKGNAVDTSSFYE